jgi:hypothetical protein
VSKRSSFFQSVKAMAAIFRAKVRRAIPQAELPKDALPYNKAMFRAFTNSNYLA